MTSLSGLDTLHSSVFVSSFRRLRRKNTTGHYRSTVAKKLITNLNPLFETPTHLTSTLRARSSVSAHMYLQLTWRGRGQTEVPQEEL